MDELPSLLETLVESGYKARSGNTAHLIVATKPGQERSAAVTVNWKMRPSEEDKQEFEQILCSVFNVRLNPDNSNDRKAIAAAMCDFLENPALKG